MKYLSGANEGATAAIRNQLQRISKVPTLLVVTLAVFILATAILPGRFLTERNFSSIAVQLPEFALLAMAVMVAMLSGGIDLSVVAVANLSGVTAALIFAEGGWAEGASPAVALLGTVAVAIAVGAVCGACNGLLIDRVGVSPILATLGTMQLFTGLTVVLTRGTTVTGLPPVLSEVGNLAIAGIPVLFLAFAVAFTVLAVVLSRTSTGLKIYLFGTNPVAARFAGMQSSSVLMRTYMISGVLAAVAGVIISARANSAAADYGTSYLLMAILVVVLAGVNPYGGFGSIWALLLALILLQFISSALSLMRFSIFLTDFAWGALLLGVMVLRHFAINPRKPRRRSFRLARLGGTD